MFGGKKSRDENRYYLLPGMGKLNRQKRRQFQLVALAVGFITSAILGLILFLTQK